MFNSGSWVTDWGMVLNLLESRARVFIVFKVLKDGGRLVRCMSDRWGQGVCEN